MLARAANTTLKLECCDQLVHSSCFLVSSELSETQAATAKKCCSVLKHFLCKDRSVMQDGEPSTRSIPDSNILVRTPRRRVVGGSVSQQNSGGPPPVPCPFCKELIPISDRDHYMRGCRAINGIFDPGGGADYSRLTPLARRAAGMTRLQRKSDVPIPGPK